MFNLFLTELHTLFLYVPLLTLFHGYSYQVEALCPIMPWRKHVYSNPSGDKVQREQVIAYFCFFFYHWLVKRKKAKTDQGQNLKRYTNFFHLSKNLDTA